MSIRITSDVFCDNCAVWVHGCVDNYPQAHIARAEAKSQGWKRRRVGGLMVDLCPRCQLTVPIDPPTGQL